MYAKLMSRITESSLMEEDVPVRYCFMMMLAMADPKGYVIGTDVAIARRMNIPKDQFLAYVAELMLPDPDSNSQENEGRRVIVSDVERGYYVVNYKKYRDTRDEEQRREYMREYMRERRATEANCKQSKPTLSKAEAEEKAAVESESRTLHALDAVIPTVEEVVKYGAGCTPVMPPGFCREQHARHSENHRWMTANQRLIDWRLRFHRFWMKDCRTWVEPEEIKPASQDGKSDPSGWREWLASLPQGIAYHPFQFANPPFLKDDFRAFQKAKA